MSVAVWDDADVDERCDAFILGSQLFVDEIERVRAQGFNVDIQSDLITSLYNRETEKQQQFEIIVTIRECETGVCLGIHFPMEMTNRKFLVSYLREDGGGGGGGRS